MAATALFSNLNSRWRLLLFLLIGLMICVVNIAWGYYQQGAQTVEVNTTSDVVDGVTSTVEQLIANPGPDGLLSFLEALLAVQNSGAGYTIRFDLPIGSTIVLNDTQVMRPGGTIIDGDVDANGTPDIVIDGPDGFISLSIESPNNVLRNLVIAGLSLEGVNAHDNLIEHNFIGSDVTGTASRGEGVHGIQLLNGAAQNRIENNLIAGNVDNNINVLKAGVILYDATANNLIAGNLIGVGANGNALPNEVGIYVSGTAVNNIIGGLRPGACTFPCNVISGNLDVGIALDGTVSNRIEGNYIGTDASGMSALPNGKSGIYLWNGAVNNTIGGFRPNSDCTELCNLISGNTEVGVVLYNSTTVGNTIAGNYIGIAANGTTALGNQLGGVAIGGGSSSNLIGGNRDGVNCAGDCNVISGNGQSGVLIDGTTNNQNRVLGNFIGTNANGNAPIGNAQFGVDVNTNTTTSRQTDQFTLPNGIISAEPPSDDPNRSIQFPLFHPEIATPRAIDAITGTQIGGTTAAAGNLISGNQLSGIRLYGNVQNTLVQNNLIGGDGSATTFGNGQHGIYLSGATGTLIGGDSDALGNQIAFNTLDGVHLTTAATVGNTIRHNRIHNNDQLGIRITNGAQQQIMPPTIYATTSRVKGVGTAPNATIDVYVSDQARNGTGGDGYSEGMRWVASGSANVDGYFDFALSGVAADDLLTATITDPAGNSSEFNYSPLVAAIEVTQVIQDVQNSVRLITGKPTYVRVFMKGVPATSTANDQIALTGLAGFRFPIDLNQSPLMPINLIRLLDKPSRLFADDAFLFQLSPDWTNGIIDLSVDNLAFRCGEPLNLHDNALGGDVQHDCQTSVEFMPAATMEISFMPFEWSDVNGKKHLPSKQDIQRAVDELQATMGVESITTHTIKIIYPINYFSTNFPGKPPHTKTHFRIFNTIMDTIRPYDGCVAGCNRYYIGLLDDYETARKMVIGDMINGMAVSTGGEVATSYLNDRLTLSHEVGHLAGVRHVLCNGREERVDSTYPYNNGRISPIPYTNLPVETPNVFYGFDARFQKIIAPRYKDLMSYCSQRWVSDYTYRTISNLLQVQFPSFRASTKISVPTSDTLLISGIVSPSHGSGSLDPIVTLNVSAEPMQSGAAAYALQLEDANGQMLASHAFDPPRTPEDDPGAPCSFIFALPKPTGMQQIRLVRDGETLDIRSSSANPPIVNLLSPIGGETWSGSTATVQWSGSDGDGDPLQYSVQYSVNSGATWQTIAVNLSTTTFPVDLDWLPGSQHARIRVVATDGFHTAIASSSADFSVTDHPPTAFLNEPFDPQVASQQMFALTGSGYDNEDGMLTGAALTWHSDRDGLLGTGQTLLVQADDLSEGTHQISLVAQDSSGHQAAETVTVQIDRIAPTPLAQLVVAPATLPLFADMADLTPFTTTLVIRQQGTGSLSWTASSDQAWVQLDQTSGVNSAEITLTIDPDTLKMGEHNATVTINESMTTHEVAIILQLTDEARTVGRYPWRNSHQAIPATSVVVTLDAPIDAGTVNANTVFVYGEQSGQLPAYFQVDGEEIIVIPVGLYKPNEEIEVVLTTQVGYVGGGSLASADVWRFRIAPTLTATGVFTDSQQQLGGTSVLERTNVALGDIDGDGDVDAIQTSTPTNQLWLNAGNGSFSDGGQPFGAHFTKAVTLGDLDGDGDLDAFVNGGVYFNDGSGSFTLAATLATGGANALDIGDLDGDGDLDAFIGNYGANTVWLNDGSGTFTDSGQQLLAYQFSDEYTVTFQVVLADLDDDGDLDAYAADSLFDQGGGTTQGWNDAIWINDGSGVFASKRTFGGFHRNTVAIADFNDDGHLDIFSAGELLTVYSNWGLGDFSFDTQYLQGLGGSFASGQAVFTSDIDGDGDLDALVKNIATIELWRNVAGFTYPEPLDFPSTQQIGFGDFNADGDVDAFLARWLNPAEVWWNGNGVGGVGGTIFLPVVVNW